MAFTFWINPQISKAKYRYFVTGAAPHTRRKIPSDVLMLIVGAQSFLRDRPTSER